MHRDYLIRLECLILAARECFCHDCDEAVAQDSDSETFKEEGLFNTKLVQHCRAMGATVFSGSEYARFSNLRDTAGVSDQV